MRKFYSPIDRLAGEMTRGKGTGAEFMTELSNKPGFKQAEVEDRDLQALQGLPKMAREEFLKHLKSKPALVPEEDMRGEGDTHHDEYTLPGGENYREILLQHPQGEYGGVGAHFGGAPNVLASMRVKDRTGPEGQKILHIEEIQSDWHKKGSQKGYAPKGEDLQAAAKKAEREYNALVAKRKEASGNASGVEQRMKADMSDYQRDMNKRMLDKYNSDVMGLTPQVMKADEAHRVAKERAYSAVPDAPYKKNWHELALKRMIQHAAQKGYDEIHITPGATQAERWGAKDEGAKGFHDLYDKMLPQFLNKFGKQYGAQVQPGSVSTINQTKRTPQPDTPENQWGDVANQPMGEAEQLAHMPPSTHPTHSFPITPQMREDVVTKGLPLYADGGEVKQHDFFPEDFSSRKSTLGRGKGNLDSKKQQITGAEQGLHNFWKWFGGSHAIDKGGKPMRLYHSTNSDISDFKTNIPSSNNYGLLGDVPVTRAATFLTPNSKFSQEYLREGHGQNVMPVHASLKKPFDLRNGVTDKHWAELEAAGVNPRAVHNATPWELFDNDDLGRNHFVDTLKKLGYDSAIFHEDSPNGAGGTQTTYAAFHPHQIKSAIGNRGTYDVNEPDVTKAKGGAVSRETTKPGPHGIIKERVTVEPDKDMMLYELMSAKRFTKKVK